LAAKGDFSIRGDELKAFYTDANGQKNAMGNDVYKVEAVGNVKIDTGEHRGLADYAIYDVNAGIIRMTGEALTLKTATDTLNADDYIEYKEKEKTAEAVGNATVLREGNTLYADRLVANFIEGPDGSNQIDNIDALGKVIIVTKQERITANRGRYTLDNGLAVLKGDVRIFRGQNELNGDLAEVNLNTGVSKLLSSPNSGRVRGVFTPNSPDS